MIALRTLLLILIVSACILYAFDVLSKRGLGIALVILLVLLVIDALR